MSSTKLLSVWIYSVALILSSQSLASTAEPALVKTPVLPPAASTTGVATPEASMKTKSFREWKSERVQAALSRVTATKTKIQVAKSKDPNLAKRKGAMEATSGSANENLEEQLQQDQAILEMARDLSVTDYFVGYLTKVQDKKAAFNEVAGKLTAEEVAELMAAYANSVFGTHNSEMAPGTNEASSERVR